MNTALMLSRNTICTGSSAAFTARVGGPQTDMARHQQRKRAQDERQHRQEQK